MDAFRRFVKLVSVFKYNKQKSVIEYQVHPNSFFFLIIFFFSKNGSSLDFFRFTDF